MKINVGCGQTPTVGWRNFDNSLSIKLSHFSIVLDLLSRLRLLTQPQKEFIEFARKNSIEYADAATKLPLNNGECEVVYSSHMLEHLDREEARRFLKEALRVLKPGGVIRLVVPDIRKHVKAYNESEDADKFIDPHLCA